MQILTAFALLIWHSHLYALHSRLRYCFTAHTTLPYPHVNMLPKFGVRFSPVKLSAQKTLDQ